MIMYSRELISLLTTILMLCGTLIPAGAVSPPAITSPADGSVLLTNTVDVTGTSEPTTASWTQTTQADFDSGLKDNITVSPQGDVGLNASAGSSRFYDDFNDNSLDSKLWARIDANGLAVSETGSELKLSGTAQSDGWKMIGIMSTMSIFENFSADLTAFSGTGTGYSTWIYLYQDSNNRLLLGVDYDVGWAGNQNILWLAGCISGSTWDTNLGAISGGAHHFQVAYSAGTVYCFLDGSLKATKSMTLKGVTGGLYARARNAADSVDARWDNVTIDPVLRTYDDFNDNAIDANRWDTTASNGISTTEESGRLRQSGTGTGGSYWTSVTMATSKDKFPCIMSAVLNSISGSGSGYGSHLALYQDDNNGLWFGVNYDPPAYGNQPVAWWGCIIDGIATTYGLGGLGPLSSGPHIFMVIYTLGTASFYLDGQLKAQKALNLQSTVCRIVSHSRLSGDTVDASWDNLTIERNRTVYDDFNDNSFDAGRWTKTEASGNGVSETGGSLRLSGTSTSSSLWGSDCFAYSINKTNLIFGDLKSITASGVGYTTGIFLWQDYNNRVSIEPIADPAWPGLIYHINILQSGALNQMSWGSAGTGIHRLGLIYANGFTKVYVDNVLLTVVKATLNNPVGVVGANLRNQGDTATFDWDDISMGWDFGTLIPSGNFTSGVNDTRCPAPVLRKISWTADAPSGSAMAVMLRSSDSADMSSPTAWAPVVNNQTTGLPTAKRYVQYKVAMSRTIGDATPLLRDITLEYRRPVSKVELSLDGQATWITAAGTTAWRAQLALPNGKTTIWVRAIDSAGDAALSSVTVTVDTAPPKGAVLINNGDEFAGDQNVTLVMNATDLLGVSSVMLGEDPDLADADWTSYRNIMPFQLSAGDGPKTVYARFRDVNGWESEIVSDSIILDTAPPAGSFVIDNGAEFTAHPNVTLTMTATDLSGVRQMLVSNLADLSGAQWMPFAPTLNWTLLPGNGERSVYVKLRDAAAHETGVRRASILLDTAAPTLTVTIDSGAAYTRYPNATVTMTATDNYRVEAMILSQSSDFSGSAWEPFQNSLAINLPAGDGLKTVFGKSRDAAGNEGPAVSDSIILDTAPPTATVVGLPGEVDSPNFTVNWSGTDVISGVASYDLQYRDGTGAWTDWLQGLSGTSATFKGLAGHNYSFRARARDLAGNVGSYPDSTDNSVYVWPKHLPVVTVTAPKAGSLATGTLRIFGTAYQPDHRRTVARVELRIDDGEWRMADGTSAWSFRLDTKKLGDGPHTLTVRAFDGERYSNENSVAFRVNNLEASTTLQELPLLFLAVLIAVVAIAGVFLVARRKRPAPAEKATLPPEAVSSPKPRLPPAPPAIPLSTPPAQVAVVSKVSVDDLDEEEAESPVGLQKAPPPEPSPYDRSPAKAGGPLPEEPVAPRLRDETSMREGKILKSLSSLPRGLPSSLWGLDMEDLASKVVSGERKDTPDGDMLVRIGTRWYYGDETDLGLFMQEYKK
jgi:hypothetical protein